MGPTPERALSPSQIKTWKDCRRKWGLLYVDKRPSKPNRYAQFGTAMHKVGESWLDKGKMVVPSQKTQEGRAFLAGIHHWPSPEFIDAVEGHIETQTAVSKYHGYRDVEFFDRDLGLWVVGDHKTCGSFQYALTEEELKTDEQAMIYTRSVMERKQVDRAAARWVYYKRNAPHGSHRVQLVVLRDDVEKVFEERIDPTAIEIHTAYRSVLDEAFKGVELTGMNFEPNALSCSKFGGCEFQNVCNLSPMEKLRSYMVNETMAEKLAARKVERQAAVGTVNPPERDREVPAEPAKVAAPVELPKATPEADKGMAARLAAKKAAAAAKNGTPQLAAVPSVQVAHVMVPAEVPYEKPTFTEVSGPRRLFRLMIDCRPVRPIVNYALAAEIVQEANAALCERNSVIDYRAVEYGKGRAELQLATRLSIELWLEKKLIKPGDTIVLHSANMIEADAMDMFIQYASEIIRP